MEHWTSTLDTREAAAFGTLGVVVKLEHTLVARTGKREVRFHLALECVERRYRTKPIMNGWRKGTLAQGDPAHPFITIQRAYHNRLAILELQNQGKFQSLRPTAAPGIYQYTPGPQGLPGLPATGEVLKTTDLKLVAALGVCGFPLLRLEGSGREHTYYLPRYGPARPGGAPSIDGHALRADWHADKESIPWEHPFAQAMRGLYNRERFLDAVNHSAVLVLLQKPRSQKAAYVPEHAGDVTLDRVKRHFDA